MRLVVVVVVSPQVVSIDDRTAAHTLPVVCDLGLEVRQTHEEKDRPVHVAVAQLPRCLQLVRRHTRVEALRRYSWTASPTQAIKVLCERCVPCTQVVPLYSEHKHHVQLVESVHNAEQIPWMALR